MPVRFFARRSIKDRVTLYTLATFVLGIWALFYVTSQMLRDDVEQLLGEQQFSTVSLVADKVNDELQDRFSALKRLAERLDERQLQAVDNLQVTLEDRLVINQLFNGGFYVADRQGTAIASVPRSANRIGINYMFRPHVAKALNDGHSSVSDVVVGKALKVPVVSIAEPIRGKDGQIIGALIGVINLDQTNFLDKITSSPYGKTGGYVLVTRQQRMIVTATDKRRVMEILPARGVLPGIDRFIDGHEGTQILVTPLGVESLVSAKAIPLTDWYMATVLPTSEAFSPLDSLQKRLFIATALLTLLAGLITWWIVRQQLQPILTTAKSLAAIDASGELPSALPNDHQDEVGELVISFNKLLENLNLRETALKANEQRLATIASLTSDLIYACHRGDDGVFRVDWISGATETVFGVDSATIITYGCWRPFVVKDDLPKFARAITDLQPGQSSEELLRITHTDGTEHWLESVARVEFDAPGSPAHRLYGALRDVSERERADAELDLHRHHLEELVLSRTAELAAARDEAEAASRAKSTFLANMSHELRTPLTAIMGMVDLVLRKNTDPKQVDQLSKAKLASQHLLLVINNILDISKIEADHLVLERVRFKLSDVLSNLVSLIGQKVTEKGLTLQVDVAHDLTEIAWLGDPLRLGQILLNFTANAVKFTGQGNITVRLRLLDSNASSALLRGEVIDSGIGIATDDQQRLFTAFEQADGSMTRKYGGTGLGLAISKRLAKLMGGEVGVESQPGQGSTFWFTVRLQTDQQAILTNDAVPPAPTFEAEIAEVQLKTHFAGARILVAEDEPVSREVSRGLLEVAGLQVDLAHDGAIAVTLARQTRYALILMDMQMPNLNGVDATREIRRESLNQETPILAMTANVFDDDRQLCFAVGMNDHIAKPINPEALFAALLKWLQNPTPATADPSTNQDVESGTHHYKSSL